jgi:hypothetical protein
MEYKVEATLNSKIVHKWGEKNLVKQTYKYRYKATWESETNKFVTKTLVRTLTSKRGRVESKWISCLQNLTSFQCGSCGSFMKHD